MQKKNPQEGQDWDREKDKRDGLYQFHSSSSSFGLLLGGGSRPARVRGGGCDGWMRGVGLGVSRGLVSGVKMDDEPKKPPLSPSSRREFGVVDAIMGEAGFGL